MKRTAQTLFALGLVVATPAVALQFTFSPIDPPGSTFTFPFGINPQGDVVGNYGAGGVTRGFLLSEGNFTSIEIPGARATLAFGINPQGDIVGWYTNSGGVDHGFLLRKGVF